MLSHPLSDVDSSNMSSFPSNRWKKMPCKYFAMEMRQQGILRMFINNEIIRFIIIALGQLPLSFAFESYTPLI